MEHKPTEDIGTRHIPSLDDVEGHMPLRPSLEAEEDLAGHATRVKVFVENEDGDDDVEGHAARVKF